MGALTYAFFPLYPVMLFLMNFLFNNIQLTAFVVSNLFLLANFLSLYYIISKFYSENIAIKTIFLVFLFPFSIFYRSYYPEGLFLFLLVWFCFFLIQKKWFFSSVIMSLLLVTRPNGLFLSVIFFYSFFQALRKKELSLKKAVGYTFFSFIPFGLWLYFCFVQTGNALFWYSVQSVWFQSSSIVFPLLHNLTSLFSFWKLPFHSWHESKIDTFVAVSAVTILLVSKKYLKPQLWWVSFFLVVMPLLTKDTMSYSRYQIVSFPLFIFLAERLNNKAYSAVVGVFFLLLFITSLFFVNWFWLA
jgi:hypothetical protein